jgi:iron complex transport system substrate-binding protein
MTGVRICSLLPSATEIAFALGLGDRLVGVTHECDYPPEAARLPVLTRSTLPHTGAPGRDIDRHVRAAVHVGSSLYALDQARLEALDPDLVLTQELCDVCAVSYREVRRAVRLLPGERQILSLEPTSLEGILATIVVVGAATGVADRAATVVAALRRRIARVATTAATERGPRVAAFEWLDPPFSGGHWVPEMIRSAGGHDGLGREGQPSAEVAWAAVAAYDPEVVVLMPCGFDLGRTLEEVGRAERPAAWAGLAAVRTGRVYAVNGSAYFNRPGPRIVEGLEILGEILHPDRFPRQSPPDAWRRVGG